MENLFAAIEEAHNSKDIGTFVQLTSLAVKSEYTNKGVSKKIGINAINDATYAQVNHHAKTSPGMPADYGAKDFDRNRKHREESMVKFIAYLVEASTTSASSRKRNIGTEDVSIPVIQRTLHKNAIIASYRKKHPNNGLSNQEYYNIMNFLAPSKDKILGALDTSTETNGRQNFKVMRLLINRLKDMIHNDDHLNDLAKQALKLVELNEDFLKSADGLKSDKHLGSTKTHPRGCCDNEECTKCDTSGPASHCLYYLMKRRDPDAPEIETECPCGHDHRGRCLECEQVFDLVQKITEMRDHIDRTKYPELTREASADREEYGWGAYIGAGESRAEEMMKICGAMGVCLSRFYFYYAHRVRLINEDHWEQWVIDKLKKNPKSFAVQSDWAMKYLSVRHREMQSDFFGKRGILWFGSVVMWYDVQEQKIKQYFTNQISTDNTEDAYSSMEQIAATVKFHRDHYSELGHNSFHLRTDGAFYFTSPDFTCRLPYIQDVLGIKCLSHCKGEAGGGKCCVDAKFGSSKGAVDDLVIEGGGDRDVNTACDLVRSLQEIHLRDRNNVPNTYSFMVSPNYDHDILYSNMPSGVKKDAKMGSSAMRKFSEDGEIMHIDYSSFLDKDKDVETYKPDCVVRCREVWGDSSAAQILPVGVIHFNPEEKREGVKIEESQRMLEMRSKRIRKEKRQAKARIVEQQKQDGQTKRKFPCPTTGCIMQYSNQHLLDRHLASGGCCTNGNAFRAPIKKVSPTRYSGLTGRSMYAKMMEDVTNDPNLEFSGIAAARCTVVEGSSTAAWGQAADARRMKSKTPRNVIEAIKGMTELGAQEESRKKINPHDMLGYLMDMGLDSVAATFPTIPAFSSNNNTKLYEDFEMPLPDKVKSISLQHLAKLKKDKAISLMVKLDAEPRGRVMIHLLTTKGGFSEDEATSITNELISHGVGDRINTATLKQKDLQNLPISGTNDWSRQQKRRICESLRADLARLLPKVPTTITYRHSDPVSLREAETEEGNDDEDDDGNQILWYDDDGDNDEDDNDSLDIPDENGVSERLKMEFHDSAPVDALTNAYPLDHGEIRRHLRYVGKTFDDTEVVVKRRKGKDVAVEKKMKYQISNVCIYKNDPTTFFFEYFDCEKHQKRPNELRHLQYTEVIEFGRALFFQDELGR